MGNYQTYVPPLHRNQISTQNEQRISLFFTAVWILYLLISPIYVFSKGLPQPADYLIFAFGFPALLIAMIKHQGSMPKVFIFGIIFAGLTIAINLIHFSYLYNDRLLKHSLYYIFNFCVFLYTLIIFRQNPERVNQLTYYAVATIIIFQFFYAPLFGEVELLRNLGSFNNPNQLAYWSLLNMAILIVLKRDKKFTFFDLMLFGMCIYLESLSLSKAGMIITVLMTGTIFFLPNVPRNGRYLMIAGFIIFLMVQLFEPETFVRKFQQVDQITKVVARIQNIGQESDDSAEGRGYDRLIKYPHYLVFGAGEGAFYRFGIGAQEIHSGIATLLFSYGVTGFVFFGLFLWAVFNNLPKQYYILLFLIFLFGIPHQNIRFTYFWVFLALAHTHHMYFAQQRQKEEESDSPHNQ